MFGQLRPGMGKVESSVIITPKFSPANFENASLPLSPKDNTSANLSPSTLSPSKNSNPSESNSNLQSLKVGPNKHGPPPGFEQAIPLSQNRPDLSFDNNPGVGSELIQNLTRPVSPPITPSPVSTFQFSSVSSLNKSPEAVVSGDTSPIIGGFAVGVVASNHELGKKSWKRLARGGEKAALAQKKSEKTMAKRKNEEVVVVCDGKQRRTLGEITNCDLGSAAAVTQPRREQ